MISKSLRSIFAGLGLASVLASTAQGQSTSSWRAQALGVAEIDTEGTLYLLGGLSATTGGAGLRPIVGVQLYNLNFDGGTDRINVFGAKPYVGLGTGYNGGSFSGTVGYAFTNRESNVPFTGTGGDVGEGVVLSGAWDHWGTGTPWGHQVLASYNFGAESFWGRGRLTRQISSSGQAQRRFGGEVALLHGDGYSGYQPGAIFEMHNGRGGILGLGAGMKFMKNADDAFYFKIEGVVPVGR